MSQLVRIQRPLVDPFESMTRDFDSFVQRVFGGRDVPPGLAPYAVDIREDNDHLYVEAELPGFDNDQVEITLDNHTITISAERKLDEAPEGSDWLLRERRFHRFQRSFTLPNTLDESSVSARLDRGILSVRISKKAEAKPRKISIDA